MSFFTASPFLNALGWALLNSIWQFAIAGFIYWVLSTLFPKLSAAARHSVALILLFSGTVVFLITLSWKYYSLPATDTIGNLAIRNNGWYNAWFTSHRLIDTILPYWSLLYLLCVVILFIKFFLFVKHASHIRNSGMQKMPANWRVYIRNIADQLGVQKEIKAVLSMRVDTPQVIGVLKPVILVPFACLTNLSTEQLEAVLLHELVHIKRNDYLINIFIASAEILFFFNPFVGQLIEAIRKEREYSCDDMVIQFKYEPGNYAAALLALEKDRIAPVTFGIAANGRNKKQLLSRVQRIVGINNNHQDFSQLGAYLFTAMILGFIAFVNPVRIAAEKLDGNITFYTLNRSKTNNPQVLENTVFFNNSQSPQAHSKNASHKKQTAQAAPRGTNNKDDAPADELQLMTVSDHDPDTNDETFKNAAATEVRDFTLPESRVAATAPSPELATMTPYIPTNSFSFQVIQDSSHPKSKNETYNQRAAREAMVKAQIAVAEINWKKIERSLTLKTKKASLTKLKTEIAGELAKLNWEQINSDVQRQLNQEQAGQLKVLAEQDQSIKKYRQTQYMYEALQKQLLEQEQVIKESDQQAQKSLKTLDQQQKRVQLEMKKRRIIYI